MLDILSMVFIGVGCALGLIGGIGLLRLPDTYARLHAVGVTDTLCTFLILLGLAFQAENYIVVAKLALIFMFLTFSSPASSYALANNAWRWGLRHKQKIHVQSLDQEDT
ncbi:monovalent cation/H(+) antiporter subunit G [Glaciecola sp. XM2]|jgi:multicomponent Na+:H+ antiporter subunit G|uniref:monovalent cation/H(+) antiporter subunit G n=1 Tax=Glaciecola sp. XM2 TaxID=1914931 RepID=UPI001BDE2D5B|nr:monovalent cation/H(+) antiporter subunit G [Glaciecola sp. XM2]MBT1449886.1 monovalent cation/H(+) antiporter subunit G [Glaciecola sp. XM2]